MIVNCNSVRASFNRCPTVSVGEMIVSDMRVKMSKPNSVQNLKTCLHTTLDYRSFRCDLLNDTFSISDCKATNVSAMASN